MKWLEDLRMLAPYVPGAHLFSPDDSEDLDVLTPLVCNLLRATLHSIDMGEFTGRQY